MALINCEECRKQISDRAAACPHCGCPLDQAAISSAPDPVESQSKPPELPPVNPNVDLPPAWKASSTAEPLDTPKLIEKVPNRFRGILLGSSIVLFLLLLMMCSRPSKSPESGATNVDSAQSPNLQEPAAPVVPKDSERIERSEILADTTRHPNARLNAAQFLITNFPETPDGKKAAALVPELTKALEYENTGTQWIYVSSPEGMSGKESHTARVVSSNMINLDFPYAGAQHATLVLRRHPRWGNDVILQNEKGQILCHSYGDCSVGIRFDDGKVIRVNGNEPADNSSESVFIPAFSTFMKKLPSAKSVMVEVQIYQGGSQIFEFDVSGFKPEKFK